MNISRLYQAPLAQFTEARNALAKELRDQGHAEEAARVAKLRKPSAVLWLANQMAHRQPKAVAALIESSRKMRELQQKGGSGDELREAMREQREAMEKLLDTASEQKEVAFALAAQRRLQSTLQAAAMSEPDALREGRIESELQAAGFEAVIGEGMQPRAAAPKDEKELHAAEKEAARLASRAEAAQLAAAKAEAAAAKAREEAREARAAADAAAAKALELRRK